MKKWNDLGRVCSVCLNFKPWEEYSWKNSKRYKESKSLHQTKQPKCKSCAHIETKNWRNSQSTDRLRDLYYKNTYGISLEEFNNMFILQEGKCKICYRPLDLVSLGSSRAVVDHCHTSNKIRGVLCNECNRGLGYFRDNPEALLNASKYIKENL